MFELIKNPWPWYITGPLIGLTVPALLIVGNKSFGISSSLRHVCAACVPAKIPFFRYDWKKEIWNLVFVAGVLAGGMIAFTFLSGHVTGTINPRLITELSNYGISKTGFLPSDVFNWSSLLTLKGLMLGPIGGLLIGFGSRYAGGCTSGHAIMGLSNLQFPSLVATTSFMLGGIVIANWLLPVVLSL